MNALDGSFPTAVEQRSWRSQTAEAISKSTGRRSEAEDDGGDIFYFKIFFKLNKETKKLLASLQAFNISFIFLYKMINLPFFIGRDLCKVREPYKPSGDCIYYIVIVHVFREPSPCIAGYRSGRSSSHYSCHTCNCKYLIKYRLVQAFRNLILKTSFLIFCSYKKKSLSNYLIN